MTPASLALAAVSVCTAQSHWFSLCMQVLKQQTGGDTTAARKTLQGPGLRNNNRQQLQLNNRQPSFRGGGGGSTSQITAGRGGGACVREKQECIPQHKRLRSINLHTHTHRAGGGVWMSDLVLFRTFRIQSRVSSSEKLLKTRKTNIYSESK